jgi:hypothetical protein
MPGGIMIYVSADYQADSKQATQLLFRPTNALVEEYGYYIDAEGAGFLRSYFMSLKLDLELALTGNDQPKARLIMQELEELCRDLQKRIDLAKQAQGEPATGRRKATSTQSPVGEA